MWKLTEESVTVATYNISFVNLNNKACFNDSDNTLLSETAHTLSGLISSTEYCITVTAQFSDGGSVSNNRRAITLAAG